MDLGILDFHPLNGFSVNGSGHPLNGFSVNGSYLFVYNLWVCNIRKKICSVTFSYFFLLVLLNSMFLSSDLHV
jgi:hypothetical protein